MKRVWTCLLLLATAYPVCAEEGDGPYYGPMKRWNGIGFKYGYEDRIEKDGSWRVTAATRGRGDAIDMALYRAAERARDEGYRYIFFLGGRSQRSPGIDSATVYARPSQAAVPPTGCRSKKVATCYTADVAEVLRILGGPGGNRPGTAIVDGYDEFGRQVFLSGYGTGGVATLVPGGVARSYMTTIVGSRSAPAPVPVAPPAPIQARAPSPPVKAMVASASAVSGGRPVVTRDSADLTADERFQRALKANQPVRGREPKQGWSISD